MAYLHNDIVNGDVDELDEEPNEAHDCKTNRRGHGNLLKLCTHLHKTGMNHTAFSTFNTRYLEKRNVVWVKMEFL